MLHKFKIQHICLTMLLFFSHQAFCQFTQANQAGSGDFDTTTVPIKTINDDQNQRTDWDFNRVPENPDTPTGDHEGDIHYYHFVLSFPNGLTFDIKTKRYTIVIEDRNPTQKEGIMLALSGNEDLGKVLDVQFSDSEIVNYSLPRFHPESSFLTFRDTLQSQLSNYHDLTDWDTHLINANWDEGTTLSPCDQAIVDLVKSLMLYLSMDNKQEVLNVLDGIFQAQIAFRSECNQD